MAKEEKMQDIIEAAEGALFQKIIDRQEGALGLEKLNQPRKAPTQAELARWERALDKLGAGETPPIAHGRKRFGRTALLAILAAAFLLIAASALYRPILNWVESIHETYTQLQASSIVQEKVNAWTAVYIPSYLPQEFSISDAFEFEDMKMIEYANTEGQRLTFYQYGPKVNVRVDTEGANKTILMLTTGAEAYLVDKGTLSTLYWSDGGHSFSIEFDPSKIETSEIQAFAGSIQWKQ